MPDPIVYQEANAALSVAQLRTVALSPFSPQHALMQPSLKEHVRQSLRDHMPRGLYIGGGIVMCSITRVPLTGLWIENEGIVDDFEFADSSSWFPIGVVLPLITASGAAAPS